MRLQPYKYKLVFRKWKQNIADPFSRLSETHPSRGFDDNDDHAFIRAIMESVAVDVTEIEKEIERDPELLILKQAFLTDD